MATPVDPYAQQRADLAARLDPSHPNYVGPGYVLGTGQNGGPSLMLVDPVANQQWKTQQSVGGPPALPQAPPAIGFDPTPQQTQTTLQRLQGSQPASGFSAPLLAQPGPAVSSSAPTPAAVAPGAIDVLAQPQVAPVDTSQTPQEAGPAQFNRERVDNTLANLNKATSGLFALGESDANLEAVMAKSAYDVEQARRAALGVARGGSRRDMAANERVAIAAGQTAESDAQRATALAGAQAEVDNQRVRLDALKAAGDLGLNQSALEIDVGRMNLDAVTNYWNQRFEDSRLDRQLSQQEAERLTNFTRDMALIARDYYQMSIEERQAIRDDLTRRYGIDQQLAGIVKQLDAEPGFWEKAGLGLVAAMGPVGAALITRNK